MRSATMEVAYGLAEPIATRLVRSRPEGLRHAVHIIDDEGTAFFYVNAFAFIFKHGAEFLCVVPEHRDLQVFDISDLYSYKEFNPVEIPREEKQQ